MVPEVAVNRPSTSNPVAAMNLTPFVDNLTVTLADAVGKHLAAVRKGMPAHLDIASGFFDLPGFLSLAALLQEGDSVQLLLGAEPPREADLPPARPGDPTGPERFADLLRAALDQQRHAIATARDRLPFTAETEQGIELLHALIDNGTLKVRRLESQFLPARGILVRSGGGAFVGETNLTAHGLGDGPTVVLGHGGTAAVNALWQWFDRTWESAADFDLKAIFPQLTGNEQPFIIFLRTLYALYGDEFERTRTEVDGSLPLTTFQTNGVRRVESIIAEYGGALVADGVGLGKTFTAAEVIRKYERNGQKALLVCPAALRDGSWKSFKDRFRMFIEIVSYEELAADHQLGGDRQTLNARLHEYKLIVVDEAHNYRNDSTPKRAGVLRKLLANEVPKDILLLSATPVNNSLWDLYTLLEYFLKSDGALASRGVPSLLKQFKDAERTDPGSLSPDVLWPVLDATTVKRNRAFVKKHYQNEQIKLNDGRTVPLTFPDPKPLSITYRLDDVLPGFVGELEAALMPQVGSPLLKLARYQPENYRSGVQATEGTVIGLLRSALLKRFESSVFAFNRTVSKMVREHEFFLKGLANEVVYEGKLLRDVSAADDLDADEVLDELAEKYGPGKSASDYDAKRLKKEVESDLQLLKQFEAKAKVVSQTTDPKLAALSDELAKIAAEAAKEGIDEDEKRRNRKVLVFSYFADTVDWIHAYLEKLIESDPRLAVYRGRLAAVTGGDSDSGMNRDAAVKGFAPESSGVPGSPDLFDILIATDVLAEGLNLQVCRNIVNYDLPWNPMRLVQRHGRIDRIGSPHKRVYLRTVFPDDELDRLLELESRVKAKLAQASASVGVEAPPIEGIATQDQTFAETRKEIEKLRAGDPSVYEAGGTHDATQSSEEYRETLRKALLVFGKRIRHLPWRSGSGVANGKDRGYVFTATVGEQPFLRFVPYGAKEAPQVVRNDAMCLRALSCTEATPRHMSDDLLKEAFQHWSLARQAIHADWQHDTDPANLQPKVPPFLREVAAFLRKYSPADTTPEQLAEVIATISCPIPRRIEMRLREAFGADYSGNRAKATAVANAIRENGLQPIPPRSPLAPIEIHEVHLICWMGVEN